MDRQPTPFYQRLALVLISLTILCVGVYYGKGIILPILFAILLSMLLLPIANFLVRNKFPKPLSIVIPLFLSIVTIGAVVYFLSTQVMNFLDDAPALRERITQVSASFQKWLTTTLNISVPKQNQYLKDTVEGIKGEAPTIVGATFLSITEMISYLVLLPIYTFLILYYRATIKVFFIRVFKNGDEERVHEILSKSGTIAQQYITGLLIETTIVFTLNTIGFLILGIKYAIFLALLAALLNLIPYVGMLVANIMCMVITLVTSENISDVLWVGIILAAVQFIDNNFGMPLIVGNKVRINALVTIIGVLVGGALCGIPGMFLAIPALAVLKVIFDNVSDLQPWGLLLGDEVESAPKNTRFALPKLKRRTKTVKV
ncbi:MAG TPA: AI-2E family transporter [Chryseolinea sp.]|jgi:predicted PurR-regulated permease PerM|nr:AI-2E family transporter [Chryseolinea sp.]